MMKVDDYCPSPFQKDTLPRHASGEVPAVGAADPEQKIAGMSMLTAREPQQLLVEWNDTKRDYLRETPLAALVEAQASRLHTRSLWFMASSS